MNANALGTAAGLALTGAALGQFSGPYAPAGWTFNANGGDGSVNTAGAPGLHRADGQRQQLRPH